MAGEPEYVLKPPPFTIMEKGHVLIKALDDTLQGTGLGTPDVRREVVELLSEVVFNAVEHGVTTEDAHAHVRHLPERRGWAFDCVLVDQGPSIRATLAESLRPGKPASDSDAVRSAAQNDISRTDAPDCGVGLWKVHAGMRPRSRKP